MRWLKAIDYIDYIGFRGCEIISSETDLDF